MGRTAPQGRRKSVKQIAELRHPGQSTPNGSIRPSAPLNSLTPFGQNETEKRGLILPNALKAVLFDLDGTLHDRNATIRRWLTGHMEQFALPEPYAARFLELDDFGYRSKSSVIPQLLEEFSLSHDPEELLADFSDRGFSTPQLMPYAHDILRELRRQGHKTGIVTNGWVEAQTRVLEGLGLFELVDDVIISKAVGLSKPDPRIYELALSRLGVTASDTWFVGDSPRNDVWGPAQVGLKTAFLPTGHALEEETPDVVLTDLRGVLKLVTSPRAGS